MIDFWEVSWVWSIRTFGNIFQRGPKGPLDHLKKEIKEVEEALNVFLSFDRNFAAPEVLKNSENALLMELIDCQMLLFDVARRAGFSYEQYEKACWEKLEENEKRKWPSIEEQKRNKAVLHKKG